MFVDMIFLERDPPQFYLGQLPCTEGQHRCLPSTVVQFTDNLDIHPHLVIPCTDVVAYASHMNSNASIIGYGGSTL